MRSNYKKIGDYIELVDERNKELKVTTLLGLSISKQFIPSVANTIGTNMKNYKIIRKNQFACSVMQVRRDGKMPVALLKDIDEAIISQAYPVFQVKDETKLLPEYLMMWFTRSEFDREATFHAVGGVRGSLEWEDFLDFKLPIPSIEKQREIVAEYNTVSQRIKLNETINQKLEETAQALYKHWFVNDKRTLVNLNEYIEFNPKHSIKRGSLTSYIEMADLHEDQLSIKGIIKREFKSGSKFKNDDTLLARITPCFENGKTAFVNCLNEGEIAFGSTEFIVMRAKKQSSIYWVYCLARDDDFREHAISSMIGSDGRQRVSSDYLKEYKITKIENCQMERFDDLVSPLFKMIKIFKGQSQTLQKLQSLLLARMTKAEVEKVVV